MPSLAIAGAIFGPILVICVVVMIFFYYRTSHNRGGMHHHLRHGEDSIEAPDHPILKGVSLKHMIEMTTSGSGSGKFTSIIQGVLKCFLVFV